MNRSLSLRLLAAAGLLDLAPLSPARAATIYDAGADMKTMELASTTGVNPNGQWTYGTAATTGSPFQVVNLATFAPYGSGAHTEEWNMVGALQGYTDNDTQLTSIAVVNTSNSPVTACCGFQIDPGTIFVHAGVVAQRDSVIQWKAPASGSITINSTWIKKGGAAGEHQVYLNNNSINGPLFGTETFNSGSLSVNSGDIVSFVQGPQANGAFDSTSTQFNASISFVPEPSSVALAGLGAACLCGSFLRRRARNVSR